ncbi:MAG TPA: murein biosynthesis integral membrane protein MurJ [bacterium]|nr:murein biosynthesis integral membrane protein MurJ [bacterium]
MADAAPQRLARAATLMAAATVASRVLGLLREVVAAALFGATNAKAAYVIAYYLPFFVQRLLLGGTLSIVFIPTISRYLARGEGDEARRVSGNLLTLVLLLGLGMVAAGQLIAPLLVPLAAPGFTASPGLIPLAVELTRIIFVAMLFLALSVYVTGFLQAHHHFTVPALAPLLFNGVIIVGTLLLGTRYGIRGLAVSWILGTAAQFLVQLPAAWRLGLRFGRVDLQHPAVRDLGRLAVPAMLGLAVIEINAYVGRFFASFIPATATTNAVAVLDYAYEVIQAPAGIFAISIATAIFPLLAAHAATDAREELRATAMLALRTVLVIILPISALAVAAREPLIALLFERGVFTGAATRAVAAAVAAYALGLPAIAAYYVVTRAYYALQDMATPVRIGGVMILLNAGLDYVLMRVWGAAGIALATSIVSTANVLTLLYLLRHRLDGVEGSRVRSTALRAGGAAVVSGAIISAAIQAVAGRVAALGMTGLLVQLAAATTAGGAVYLLLCRMLGVSELGVAWAMLMRRRPGVPGREGAR